MLKQRRGFSEFYENEAAKGSLSNVLDGFHKDRNGICQWDFAKGSLVLFMDRNPDVRSNA